MEDNNYSLFDVAPPVGFELLNDSNNRNNNYNNNINIQNKREVTNYQYGFNRINEINKNKHKLDINIPPVILKELNKEYLIDLIIFIKGFCEMSIEEKNINFKHDIFRIIRKMMNINEYSIIAQNKNDKNVLNINRDRNKENNNKKNNLNDNIIKNEKNDNINEIKEDKKNENNNIINNNIINEHSNNTKESIPINIENNKYTEYLEKRYDQWFCINHNRYFKTYLGYKQHCNSMHKLKCEKCGIFFATKRKLNRHCC